MKSTRGRIGGCHVPVDIWRTVQCRLEAPDFQMSPRCGCGILQGRDRHAASGDPTMEAGRYCLSTVEGSMREARCAGSQRAATPTNARMTSVEA